MAKSQNIDIIARQLDRDAFGDDMKFADRYAARRRATDIVANDHKLAIVFLAFASLSEKSIK